MTINGQNVELPEDGTNQYHMPFIMLNQLFQAELGFIPLRSESDFFEIGYKNSLYIWGPAFEKKE